MVELLLQFKDYIVLFLEALLRSSTIFLPTLAVVYIVGRFFELTSSYRVKNFIAMVFLFGISAFQTYTLDGMTDIVAYIWTTFLYGCYATILYVIIGFRLFDRVDAFLDRKIGKDKGFKKPVKKKKK
jgi:hypothetical protein